MRPTFKEIFHILTNKTDSSENDFFLDDVDFDVNPVFEKRRDYNFLSDVEVSRRSKTESSSFEFENAKSRKSIEKVIKKIDKDFGGRDEYDEHFLVVLEMIFNDLLNKKL